MGIPRTVGCRRLRQRGAAYRARLLVAGWLVTASAAAGAETALWVARKGQERVYVAGTIHVLRAADYPLPAEFTAAYRRADRVFLETDMEAVGSPAMAAEMRERMTLAPGRTLEDELSPAAMVALREYCAGRGIPVAPLERFKPALVVLNLMGLELARLGADAQGVDAYFHARARRDGKPVDRLEAVEDQLGQLAAMGAGDEGRFVLYSLADLERTGELLDELIAAWRTGDLEALDRLYLTEMRTAFPRLYRDLLVRRNRSWLARVERMFGEPGTELVLVGAAHLAGEDGLLRLLEREGYEVRRY